MRNLKELLDQYQCTYTLDEVVGGQLNVRPLSSGLSMSIYGSFAKDDLSRCELYSVQVDGYSEEVTESSSNEERVYDLIVAILDGNYRYELKKKSFWDKLWGGSVYLTIGQNIVREFHCHEQKKLRKRLNQGDLDTAAYTKSPMTSTTTS